MDYKKLERKIEKLKKGDLKAFDYIYDYTNRIVYFSILKIVRDKIYA